MFLKLVWIKRNYATWTQQFTLASTQQYTIARRACKVNRWPRSGVKTGNLCILFLTWKVGIFTRKKESHEVKENPQLFLCLHFLMVKIEISAHWSVLVFHACPSLNYISVKNALIFCCQITCIYHFDIFLKQMQKSGQFATFPSEFLLCVTYREVKFS